MAIERSARWLLWIAGLSLVNIAFTVGGSDFSFAVGLFGSQLAAAVSMAMAAELAMPAITWIGTALASAQLARDRR